jgi:hypothetical protein
VERVRLGRRAVGVTMRSIRAVGEGPAHRAADPGCTNARSAAVRSTIGLGRW